MRLRTVTAGPALAVLAAATLALTAQPATAVPSAAQLAAPPTVNVSNVNAHLQQLQSFAGSNGGNRATGTAGHTATTTYLQQKLQAAGFTVTVQTCTTCNGSAKNIIADWPGGDTSNTYMFGAHSDSVSAGPGINDDGSGSATLLEAALQFAASNPTMTNHLRFGWWAGEEQGLIGSKFYVNSLTSAQKTAIKAYGTFDMVASLNGGYFVTGTDAISVKLREYFASINVPTETSTECCSDDGSFRNAGIPSSIDSTGASYTKTSAQVTKWGGTAGQAYDSCYHKACDSYPSNINTTSLGRWANAEEYALWTLTTGTTGGGGGGCTGAGQKLGNPGFETATTPWTASTGVIGANTGDGAPRTGSRDAWLDGYGTTHTDTLSQSVTLPAGCSTYTLSFYLKISTAETTTTSQYDKLTVQAGTTTLQVFSNLNASGYTLRSYDLAAFAGQTVTLKFTGVEDSGLKTSFVIDDTALNVS
jgi:aminopeptidase S